MIAQISLTQTISECFRFMLDSNSFGGRRVFAVCYYHRHVRHGIHFRDRFDRFEGVELLSLYQEYYPNSSWEHQALVNPWFHHPALYSYSKIAYLLRNFRTHRCRISLMGQYSILEQSGYPRTSLLLLWFGCSLQSFSYSIGV